jgi:hypothetical protein
MILLTILQTTASELPVEELEPSRGPTKGVNKQPVRDLMKILK